MTFYFKYSASTSVAHRHDFLTEDLYFQNILESLDYEIYTSQMEETEQGLGLSDLLKAILLKTEN